MDIRAPSLGAEVKTEVTTSNGRATLIGTLWVNIPVLFIMFGGWAGIPALALTPHVRPLGSIGATLIVGGWIFVPFAAAWTW